MMPDKDSRLQGIKIARVSTIAFFVETQLRSQIASLVEAGADVTVVASDQDLAGAIPGARYVSINIPRKISLVKDFIALIKLWLFFRTANFDVVHSTTPKAGLLCSLAGWLAGVPVRIHTFTGQPWVGLSGIKRFLAMKSERIISRLNTHCYADSHSQREFIIENGVARLGQVSVLGAGSLAGIDLQRFDPARFTEKDRLELKLKLGITQGAQVLLFVGRLTRDKGIIELLRSFQSVLGDRENAFLVLLGPRDEADVDVLLDDLSPAVRQRISMPGFSHEPERYMAIADLLVLPSYREGFGTVVIEAAAMGVPTIGTNIYGLSDAIVNGKTGLLVPVRNFESLAAAIDMLLSDSALRLEMGGNARARVENEFSNTWMSALVIDEYVSLLRASRERL